jgi:Amt family ammonium transporter
VLIGFFADASTIPGAEFDDGIFFGGGAELLLDQLVAMGSVIVFSFVVTFAIAKVLKATMGLRVDEETELVGLDRAVHAETGYHEGPTGVLSH